MKVKLNDVGRNLLMAVFNLESRICRDKKAPLMGVSAFDSNLENHFGFFTESYEKPSF